jgi:CheY-like chemotaxis protein
LDEIAKILVVDDQPEDIHLIKHYFRNFPYKISSATNGKEALQLVAADPPDIILLDVVMPGPPVFECVPYFLECKVQQIISGGDLDVVMAEIIDVGAKSDTPPLDLKSTGWKYGG